MADFVRDLRKRPALAARGLESTILTAARSGETLGMTWSEVNLDRALWTVPAERMKAGAEHQVPLSRRALALLRELRPKRAKGTELVFRGSGGVALSNMSMAMLLRRMRHDGITVHGFRSTFRDWAGETTSFAREEVEMAPAHTIGLKAERAYRRGRAVEKRRELMEAWAGSCGGDSTDRHLRAKLQIFSGHRNSERRAPGAGASQPRLLRDGPNASVRDGDAALAESHHCPPEAPSKICCLLEHGDVAPVRPGSAIWTRVPGEPLSSMENAAAALIVSAS